MTRGDRQEWISSVYLRIKEINAMPTNNQRNKLISEITAEITFMYYHNILNGTEYRNLLEKISLNEERKLSLKEKDAAARMMGYHSENLTDLYSKVRLLYEKNPSHYYNFSFNDGDMREAFINFLEYVGCRDLYESIKNNNMFLIGANKIKKGNPGLCIPKRDLSYIILGQNPKASFEYYINLIYEIAFAYVNKILYSDKLSFEQYKCYYYFIPPTFCRIFIDFLMKKKVFDVTKLRLMRINNEMLNYEKILDAEEVSSYIARKGQKVTDSKKYEEMIKRVGKDITPFVNQEALGIIASFKLFSDYQNEPEDFILDLGYIIKKMRKLPLQKLIESHCSVESAQEIIEENLGRSYIKK